MDSLTPLLVFSKDFIVISYENVSFPELPRLEDSIGSKLIYLLTTIPFWLVKCIFLVQYLEVLHEELLLLAFIAQTAIMQNFSHCINSFRLFISDERHSRVANVILVFLLLTMDVFHTFF